MNRRSARSAFGGLLIRQDGSEGRGPATIGAARWSRNLGGVTRVGGLVTGRVDAAGATLGARSAGTAAVDVFGRLGPTTEYNAMLSVTTGGDSGRTGVAYNGFIGRQTDRLYTGFLTTLVSADYRPATGFVSRPNILLLSPAVLGDVRPAWKPAAIRRFAPALLSYLFLDPASLRLQEGFVEWYVDVDFQDGSLFYPLVQRQFQRPTVPFSFVDGVTIPAGELDFWRVGGTFRSDASRPVSVRVDATTGGFFGGELDQGTLSLRVVPSPKVALTAGYEVNRFRRLGVERRTFTTHLLQPELRVALSPRLQATAFYQYNSEIRRGALNARLSWEFAPLSYLFVVWNDRRLAGARRPGEPPIPTTQQLILKGVWLRQF